MTKEEILQQINSIFIDILDLHDLTINYATIATDIDAWDSLTHIQLIVGIEKHFRIRFKSDEINNFNNVGEMCDSVLLKMV